MRPSPKSTLLSLGAGRDWFQSLETPAVDPEVRRFFIGHTQSLTEREVCAWLNTSKRNLFCWRKAGLIPYLKIGRAVRFRRDEVEKSLSTRIHNHDQP